MTAKRPGDKRMTLQAKPISHVSNTPLERFCLQADQKDSDARRAKNRSFDFRSGQAPHQVPKSNVGGGKCNIPLLHRSIIPASGTLERDD